MNTLKKCLTFLIVLTMIMSTVCINVSADAFTAKIETVSTAVKPGDTVDVGVSLENCPGVIMATIKVNYDSTAMELVGVEDAGKLGTFQSSPKYTKVPYTLKWGNTLSETNFMINESAKIATLKFKIKEDAAEKDYDITVSEVTMIDVDSTELTVGTTNGKITVAKDKPVTKEFKTVIGNSAAKKGETAEVDVSLENCPGVIMATIKVNYDSTAMELVGVEDAGKLGTFQSSPKYTKVPYTLKWGNTLSETNFMINESAKIATLKFKIKEDAAEKDYDITVSEVTMIDVDSIELTVGTTNGKITVTGGEEPPAPTKHTITFKNGDEVLKTYEVEDGKMPAYDGETPVKASTDEFDYTFKGWTPAIVAATADATYTAEFEATKKKYEITFNNYDGSKLTSTEVEYGTMPAYEGETPVKPEDDENTYKFIGWTPELANVTGAATYTAKFEAMPKAAETFKVTFKDDAGNVLHEEKFVKDTMPVYNGKKDADGNPAKDADTEFTYKFVKWDKEFAKVTADAEYVAEFEKTPIAKEFTITFKDEDGKVLYETKVPEGETPEYKGETPVKAEDENNVYEFEGWEPAIVAATADATYTAKFKATAKSSIVTITFKNGDAVLEEVKVEKGTKPEYKGEEPKKETEYAGTKVTTYKFAGWDPEIVQAEADATYTAKFEATESTRTLNSIKTDLTSLSIPNRTHKSGEEAVAAYVKDVVKVTAVYSEGPEEEVKSDDVTVTVVKSGSNATATVKYADKEATIALTYKAASSSRGNSVSGNTSKPSNPSTDDKKDEDKKDEDKKDEDKKDEDKKDEDTKPDDGNKPEDGNKPADGKFADVDDSHWAAKAAYELKAKGIISGDANNNANFDANITRQETAKLAILVNGIKAEAGDITATDAADVSDWAKDFMASAIKAGIMTGYEDGTVKPLNTITREEMVAIIIRALGVQVSDDAKLDFADKADITWSAPYVAAAVELGFVTGYEDNTFKAKQPITRAEAFVIFDRVLTFRDALTTAGAEK